MSSNRGNIAILGAMAIAMISGMFVLTSQQSNKHKITAFYKKIDRLEGTYLSELAAFHAQHRTAAATGTVDSRGRYPASFVNSYETGLPTGLTGTPPTSYAAGDPLNVKQTLSVDSTREVLRRYADGRLRYLKSTDKACGRMQFAESGRYVEVCFSSNSICPAEVCSSTLLTCLNASAISQPVTYISTENQLRNLQTGKYYKLQNDITLTQTGAVTSLFKNSIFDGNGKKITHLQSEDVTPKQGLFGATECSLIRDLTIDDISIGAFSICIECGGLSGNVKDSGILNVKTLNGVIRGFGSVGGLIGYLKDSRVAQSYSNLVVRGLDNYIDPPDGYGGLIGVAIASKITSCQADTDIQTEGSSLTSLGGLVGMSSQTEIVSSSSSGQVGVSDIYNHTSYQVGGLVGYAGLSSIVRSSSSAKVRGTQAVGGLIGTLGGGVTSQSSASGEVIGSSIVGGFVGESGGVIEDSFATGVLPTGSGHTDGGGFVGRMSGPGVAIRRSYSTGRVSPACGTTFSFVGGFSGKIEADVPASAIEASYWDTETSGCNTTSGNAQGKTTAEMQTQSTFTNWDFATVWEMPSGSGYPKLRGLP